LNGFTQLLIFIFVKLAGAFSNTLLVISVNLYDLMLKKDIFAGHIKELFGIPKAVKGASMNDNLVSDEGQQDGMLFRET